MDHGTPVHLCMVYAACMEHVYGAPAPSCAEQARLDHEAEAAPTSRSEEEDAAELVLCQHTEYHGASPRDPYASHFVCVLHAACGHSHRPCECPDDRDDPLVQQAREVPLPWGSTVLGSCEGV